MDVLTVGGIVLALISIVIGSILKGAGVGSLLNGAAFVIVVCGTFASILIQTPKATFMRAWKIAPWIFKPPLDDHEKLIAKMVEWSEIARKQGLLGLEPALESEQDPFAQKGAADAGRRHRTGQDPRSPRDGDRGALEGQYRQRQGVRGHGHLCPDARHHRRRARPDRGDEEPRRPEQARPRHRGCLYRHHLRHRPRQPVFPAHRQQAQGRHRQAEPLPRK